MGCCAEGSIVSTGSQGLEIDDSGFWSFKLIEASGIWLAGLYIRAYGF